MAPSSPALTRTGQKARTAARGVLDPLADRGDLLGSTRIRLLGTGITYGNQSAVIDETYADVIPLPVVLLADRGGDWEAAALEAVRAADHPRRR